MQFSCFIINVIYMLFIQCMIMLYINMFLYFSISLFYLSYFTWVYCVCPPFLKTVFFLSYTRVMVCMYTLYFKRCTLYKFIEINSVLLCSVKKIKCWFQKSVIKISKNLEMPQNTSYVGVPSHLLVTKAVTIMSCAQFSIKTYACHLCATVPTLYFYWTLIIHI